MTGREAHRGRRPSASRRRPQSIDHPRPRQPQTASDRLQRQESPGRVIPLTSRRPNAARGADELHDSRRDVLDYALPRRIAQHPHGPTGQRRCERRWWMPACRVPETPASSPAWLQAERCQIRSRAMNEAAHRCSLSVGLPRQSSRTSSIGGPEDRQARRMSSPLTQLE